MRWELVDETCLISFSLFSWYDSLQVVVLIKYILILLF